MQCTQLFGEKDEFYCYKWGTYKKKSEQSYNWDGISFPTTISHIEVFEKNNNASVNIFGVGDNGEIYPYCQSKEYIVHHLITFNLLHLENKDEIHYA